MKLSIRALSLSGGIISGLILLLLTYAFILMGYEGATLVKLRNIYLGYSITWVGGLIGFLWGFLTGLVFGAILAWLYNRFVPKQL
ncbi:MAG: hypothetical protein V1720_13820 [bacterium]